MSESLNCPYCNAVLPAGAAACPVCGESTGRPGAVTTEAAPPDGPAEPRKLSNAQVALLVVAVMGSIAVVALLYALLTQPSRRANDQGLPHRPGRSPFDRPAVAASPEQLAALRYLPASLDLLVGVHFAALYDDPATRPLLDQPLPLGPATIRLADLRSWTGLDPATLDHAVLGLTLQGVPRIVLVVRTRQPYSVEEVKRTLQAQEVFDAGPLEKKTLWNVRPGKLEVPAVLWLADDRTLVLGLRPSDLAGLPAADAETLGHLRGDVRGLLRQRLDPGCALWSVGRLPEGLRGLAAVAGVPDRLGLPPELRTAVTGTQSFAASVVPGQEIVCHLSVELAKAADAQRIAAFLRRPETTLKVESDLVWLLVQWKTTPEQLARLLD